MSVEGLAGVEQQISARIAERMPKEAVFEVKAGGARGAAKNALIAAVQAGYQRNPFYLNERTKKLVADAARGLVSATFTVRRAAEERIKNLLLISIGENVQAQKNPDGGRFKALTANYRAAKRRIYGRAEPILIATGQLLGGLKASVKRTK